MNGWMVRAGAENELVGPFEGRGAVAIGWEGTPDLTGYRDQESLKALLLKVFPNGNPKKVPGDAGQLRRFVAEMAPGDTVLSYDQSRREYLVGTIQSKYLFDPKIIGDGYNHVRKVQWDGRVPRPALSVEARNSLGSVLTVFEVTDYVEEIRAVLAGDILHAEEVAETPESTTPYHTEVEGRARGLIGDALATLDGYEFQRLVAAVLRAMGYATKESEKGADGGLDIRASPDALLLTDPRIKVQVKHRTGQASPGEIQQLVGAVGGHGRGLFVSTGGFSRDARREADRSSVPITLLDEEDFVGLLTKHYARLEPEFRDLVLLKQVWIPIL